MGALLCHITDLCAVLLTTVWLSLAQRQLSQLKDSMADADKLFTMHRALSTQERGGPNEEVATHMVAASQVAFQLSAQQYNAALKLLANRLPALILGYRPIDIVN